VPQSTAKKSQNLAGVGFGVLCGFVEYEQSNMNPRFEAYGQFVFIPT
jgi:hypothetical protein